jgi:hypothetical protein
LEDSYEVHSLILLIPLIILCNGLQDANCIDALHDSTWVINSLGYFAILLMILDIRMTLRIQIIQMLLEIHLDPSNHQDFFVL